MFSDFLSLILGCIVLFAATERGLFLAAIIIGLVLAAVCWYLCSIYTHLWNKRYHLTLTHHLLCAVASALTLVFVITFASMAFTRDAALASIRLWQIQIKSDQTWAKATFLKAYDDVRTINVESFDGVPPAEAPNALIPTAHDESRQVAAARYANEACRHFDRNRRFLSKIVWSRAELPSAIVTNDERQWFATHPVYPAERAIDLAASQIKLGLDSQVPRVVYLSRLSLVLFFFVIQTVPFGIIGWAAYVDIKARM